ncbi:MAG: dockerin type I repeat-containing protein, partial [bacterium]
PALLSSPTEPTVTATATQTVTPTPPPVVLLTATPTTCPPLPFIGDADDSHSVNAVDAALILQFEAGLIASLPNLAAADVNHDSSANSIDATVILQFVAGFIPSLSGRAGDSGCAG